MSQDTSPVIRLADYRPTPYSIDRVSLGFDLEDGATTVTADLSVARRPDSDGGPLILDGDELTLISVAIDGTDLPIEAYEVTDTALTVKTPPAEPFTLRIVTRIDPAGNTKLAGLYRSNGNWCTQCEAEGFRRITFFYDRPDVLAVYTVRIEAPTSASVLLSNGNLIDSGEAGEGRHFAVWNDPWPKPSYLFALVAGALDAYRDSFTTMSGRDVKLAIYVETGNAPKAAYAMDSLKRAMKWDEDTFGREYDLDVFNIVAVSDFNMGAMENKGLNIFNDKYVLADPDIATDGDYAGIEGVIAHEYFHNWTGDRITCRDWFQLCLKEGLTVFRDQEFSADMRSRPVKRIADVRVLRSQQFPEDGGPLAHPVRPVQYKEINNFYTATVYEKGAEVIRMLKALIGDGAFARGMDLYFERHDGEAATIEQFVACFAAASGRDLADFMRWYSQAGTPAIAVSEEYDAEAKRYRLVLAQSTPATPGESVKAPQVIPVRFGLVGPNGADLAPASVSGAEVRGDTLILTDSRHEIVFEGIGERPVASLLRGFSAPVRLRFDQSAADLVFLLGHDSDPFNRWQAGTSLAMTALVKASEWLRTDGNAGFAPEPFAALGDLVVDETLDPAFRALLLAVPGENDIAREIADNVDPDAVRAAYLAYRKALATAIAPRLTAIATAALSGAAEPYAPDAASAGRRSLVNAALDHLAYTGEGTDMALVRERFVGASNMTDRLAALTILVHRGDFSADDALQSFHAHFADVPLVIDKWLSVQASAPLAGTLDRVVELTGHPALAGGNPNRIRSLIGAFAAQNPTQFARADGKGFDFVAATIARLDDSNPQLASRLLVSFRSWRSFEIGRRKKAEAALKSIAAKGKLSRDVGDILERTLA